jgi:tetratricopeptide (TPR) repeat protein
MNMNRGDAVSQENETIKPLSYELPWPKELSQGMGPGLLWSVTSFFLFLLHWGYGLLSVVLMFIFFQTQRRTPVGQARKHYVQGRMAIRRENYSEALACFNKTVEIKPEAAAVYPVIGDLQFHFGDMAKFKRAYQQYFQLHPQDHHMRMWYAGKYMEVGQFAEAAKELQKLPVAVKSEPQTANLLGVCLLKAEQGREALQILEHSLQKNKETGEQQFTSRYILAKAYLQAGQKDKAREVLSRLAAEKPDFEDVADLLATV